MTKYENNPDQQPYNFWTNHHRLDEMVRFISRYTDSGKVLQSASQSNSKAGLVLELLLKGMSVVINEAMLRKVHTSQRSGFDRIRAAEDAVLQHSLEITEAIQTNVLPTDASSKLTVSWVIYVTLQSLLRRQRRCSDYARLPLERLRNTSISTNSTCSGCFSVGDMDAVLEDPAATDYFALSEPAILADPVALADAVILDSFDALRTT
ncbi:hypothetical protein DL765_000257 [Monosporascus sp. GIB2]|nr:hypothetical protein DL765_000257 [Monosporascus sp. GIB2]